MNDFLAGIDLKKFKIVDWGYTEELEPKSFSHFDKWVQKEWHGPLKYLSDHRKDVRKSLKNVMEDCQSALVFLFSYHPEKLALEEFYQSKESNGLKISSYCFGFEGKDYHSLLAAELKSIGSLLVQKIPELNFRMSLDIQPVLERDLAYRAGLGWVGKNSMLINRTHGSFLMIGSLLLNQKLPLISRITEPDHCGQCQACIVACPTHAIDGDSRTLIAEKCISTFTIELFKDGDAPKGMENSHGEIFGCDICQDVCPWNKRPVRLGLQAEDQKDFQQKNELILSQFLKPPLNDVINELEKFSVKGFEKKFKETPMARTGKKGVLKNLKFWAHQKNRDP